MKTSGIIGAGLLMTIAVMADTISSTGSLAGVPANFQSTTGTSNTPFWNNNSVDGANMNVGDYLTGSNPAVMGATNYLGANGEYLSTGTGAAGFSFLQSAVTVQATLLFSDSPSNKNNSNVPGYWGTQIGLYNLNNVAQYTTVFGSGTLYNPGDPNGVYNNNVTPQTPVTVNTWANWGIYAYSCWLNPNGSSNCSFYSSVDPQHFALFENPQSPNTFYIGFEDGLNPGVEGKGDYNDVIFKLTTTQNRSITEEGPPAVTPEPATWSILGLGLAGLAAFKRLKPSLTSRV